jgi:hypothetical protein
MIIAIDFVDYRELTQIKFINTRKNSLKLKKKVVTSLLPSNALQTGGFQRCKRLMASPASGNSPSRRC